MILIDGEKCTKCKACAGVCPALVIEMGEDSAVAAHPGSCISCWHCVAVCPVAAIECDEFELGDFPSAPAVKSMPTPAAVRNLIAMRRSVREFKDKEVPRELLEKIIASGALAPTGHNAQAVKLSVITDPKLLEKLDARIMKAFETFVGLLTTPVADTVVKAVAGEKVSKKLVFTKEDFERFRNAEGAQKQHIFRGAPVLVCAWTGPEAMTGRDDSLIAMTQMMMLANAHGLGATWIGFLTGTAKLDPTLKKPLGIPMQSSLHAAMILGWPKYKYKRTIPRRPLPVKWIGPKGGS